VAAWVAGAVADVALVVADPAAEVTAVAADVAAWVTGAAADVTVEVAGAVADVTVEVTGAAADVSVDVGKLAACACRESPSRMTRMPAARIAACTARRAMCRNLSWSTTSSCSVGTGLTQKCQDRRGLACHNWGCETKGGRNSLSAAVADDRMANGRAEMPPNTKPNVVANALARGSHFFTLYSVRYVPYAKWSSRSAG
jgi:hypothetical protein